MFLAADIREWRGRDVIDPDGHKIGELEAVSVDTGTDLPSSGAVNIGLPARRRLAPPNRAAEAGILQGPLRQQSGQGRPSIGTDGELPVGDGLTSSRLLAER